ncbi:putative dehydrogenase/threonine dehydrogenase-like Zn-dependent dehydrogenase [Sagittula marina]|uniref:Putative dehydrogenase/threonine dehydrogenase-like Zn-dependent dehydrogenase n=1 Tax=Sagittula marina TaxID=943940 RepID=A0A7W6DTC6_9RHOB|nr:bi-domain-containing oxidoreductase [Sagittula marina]MBB3988449.1 putative dehydrogenase/threonine dehydrogenase-like Zn-dependent dehydrogenase [Sagittula marina]
MKQLLQSLKNGSTSLEDVPAPQVMPAQVLVRTTNTLVSAGTERMLVEFGKGNMIQKARSQPDKVKMVLDKARTDGIFTTVEAVRSKLDQPLALGYCNVGRIIEAGSGVDGYEQGDRVVSNGKHAEIVSVPKNLCAKIPEGVSDEAAAFTVLGAIGLQGIRLVQPTLGECMVVTGLGLIGLMTVQMLRAQGCRVLGIDMDPARLELARKFGAEVVNPGAGEDVLAAARTFSRGNGVDAVIITASSKSNEIVHQAALMCRQRGRIVLVGVVGLQLSRADFYEKELTFQVSCSYGPGRYDPSYEEGGQDYPLGFVRWTEQRNFEAVLDLMASGALDMDPLITHRFAIEDGAQAMDLLASGEPSLGILLSYPEGDLATPPARRVQLTGSGAGPVKSGFVTPGKANVAFLGAGNYAGRTLIPAFKAAGATLSTVVSAGGVSAVHFGKKHGIAEAATEAGPVMDDPAIDTVVIGTRHNAHAGQVLTALRAGKHIYCEKPLCLTLNELSEIADEARARPEQLLMVGFNRRFAPHVVKMKELLAPIEAPKSFIMTVNAGDIPADHWTQDPEVGGRRIIGEGCHFIDLLRHLAGAPIIKARAICLGDHPAQAIRDDKAVITLMFEDGSTGVINYLANGHKAVAKERLEVFAAGRVLQLDNFLRLTGHGFDGFKGLRQWKQDKGQFACPQAFVAAIRNGGPAPVKLDEILESSRVSIELGQSLM